MDLKRTRIVQYLSTFCISLATLTLGATGSWPSPVIQKFHKNETDFPMSPSEISWLVSLNNPGFIIGSLPTGFLADKYGRRTAIIGSAVPFLLGMAILVCARTAWLLCLTRFVWGWATGMVSIVVGMYIGEIADKEIRGRLSVITKFMTNLGSLIPMVIGPLITYDALNYMVLVLPLSYFILCGLIPESPYYYLRQGKLDAAKKELRKLRKYKSEKDFQNEWNSMQSQVRNEMPRSGSVKELFTSTRYRTAIIIAVGLKTTQIMTGTITVKQYLGKIIEESHIRLPSEYVLPIYGIVEFLTSIMTSVLADKVGRRPLLIYSYLGTGLCLATTGTYFFFQEVIQVHHDYLHPVSALPFVCIILTNIISALGYSSIIFAIIGEIFPINVKSSAMTCLNIIGGVSGFLVAKFFQSIYNVSGYCGLFWIFAMVSFVGSAFSLFVVPEMKGKTLKEIQMQLQGDQYEDKTNVTNINTVHDSLIEVDLGDGEELKTFERKENS